MAEKEIELTLKWENDVNFTMISKQDGGTIVTVVSTDENHHLADTRETIAKICKIYLAQKLAIIGKEMME